MTKRAKVTRDSKAAEGKPRQVKEKFVNTPALPQVTAINEKQKYALEALAKLPIVYLTGSAGTGKSIIAAGHAAKQLINRNVNKIYLVRPAIAVGKSIGLLPGTIEEKLAPYFAQTISHLKTFLGPKLAFDLEKGNIEMLAVEYLRGTSFENCIVIFEEAQNFTKEEMEMLVTRRGENSQFIFTGDTKQNDLRVQSGMQHIIELIERNLETQPSYMSDEALDYLEEIGVIKFEPEDVVRSGLTKALVTMYYYE